MGPALTYWSDRKDPVATKTKSFDVAKASKRELSSALEDYRVKKRLSFPKLRLSIALATGADLSDKTLMRVCTRAGEMDFSDERTLNPIREFLAAELANQS